MIDLRYSKPKHLLLAIPAAAIAGGVVVTLGFGAHEPPSIEYLLAIPGAVILGLYVLPFALVAGVMGYFVLRHFRLLGATPCAAIGLAIGLAVAAVDPVQPFWVFLCAAIGLTSALTAYVVLWYLARPPAPNSTPHSDARDVQPSAESVGARAGGRER